MLGAPGVVISYGTNRTPTAHIQSDKSDGNNSHYPPCTIPLLISSNRSNMYRKGPLFSVCLQLSSTLETPWSTWASSRSGRGKNKRAWLFIHRTTSNSHRKTNLQFKRRWLCLSFLFNIYLCYIKLFLTFEQTTSFILCILFRDKHASNLPAGHSALNEEELTWRASVIFTDFLWHCVPSSSYWINLLQQCRWVHLTYLWHIPGPFLLCIQYLFFGISKFNQISHCQSCALG